MFCLSMYIHVQVVLSRDCFQGVIARSLKEIVHFLIDAYRLIDILKTRSLMILYTHNVQHVCIYIYTYFIYYVKSWEFPQSDLTIQLDVGSMYGKTA